jgi:hypothetical protein
MRFRRDGRPEFRSPRFHDDDDFRRVALMCFNAGQRCEHAQHLVPVRRQHGYDRARNVNGGFRRHESLRGARRQRDGLARAAADAIAASGAGGSLTMACGGNPMRGLETNGRISDSIAAGAADDAGFGKAASVDDGDRWERS